VRAEADGLTWLDRGECLRLLASVPVGRLIFTMNALPTVRVVNFAVVDDLVLVRTAADTTMASKVHGAIVSFEADELDAATRSGWSVTVTGLAELVTDSAAVARYQEIPLVPWAPGVRDQFITITTEILDGLRIARQQPPAAHPASA